MDDDCRHKKLILPVVIGNLLVSKYMYISRRRFNPSVVRFVCARLSALAPGLYL